MAFFTRTKDGFVSYYLAETAGSVGSAAFLAEENARPEKDSLSLSDALTTASLGGIFLFSPRSLDMGDAAAQETFAKIVWQLVKRAPASRGIFWIADPSTLTKDDTPPFLGLAGDGSDLASGMVNGTVVSAMTLTVANGMKVALKGTDLILTGGDIGFGGDDVPQMRDATAGTLAFAGAARGCIAFVPYIQRRSLNDDWNWGFHFITRRPASVTGLASEWLPLAGTENGGDMIGFNARFDMADTLNRIPPLGAGPGQALRSGLWFTGKNLDNTLTALRSCYRTVNGDVVTLWPVSRDTPGDDLAPSGFVFSVGERVSASVEDFHVGPFGDFIVAAPAGPNGATAELLCGLSGSEVISVRPGDTADKAARLRFFPYHPAYTDVFPPVAASPTGPQQDNAVLLTPDYTTSWVAVMPPPGATPTYAAQPEGAALFGYDPYVWARENAVLGHVDPGLRLPEDGSIVFPMVPYANFTAGSTDSGFDQQTCRDFEAMIIGPTRRARIGVKPGRGVLSARAHAAGVPAFAGLGGSGATATETRFTTPSGLIATIDTGDAAWTSILLGQVDTPVASVMAFDRPTQDLQEAFQTNQLFLVVANGRDLVRPEGAFRNSLNIGGWTLAANVGQSPEYGDYTNVIIVKGKRGKLFDPSGPADENLVANPSKWSQADSFAAPTTTDTDANSTTPDPTQMIALSQWLQDYFRDALDQPDAAYFDKFNAIAQDENWTGILVLRAKIANPPADLAGIAAGVRNVDRYHAHHFGVEISQIKSAPGGGGIGIDKQSSVFGLIYYEDAAYQPPLPGDPVQPVVPQPAEDYDFITLTLKVLFQNTAVKSFSSFTQLTTNRLFGSQVTDMGAGGNPYNSVVMAGTFQSNNAKPTYSMQMAGDYVFNIANNVLQKVEMVSAQMLTIAANAQTTRVRFVLNGFLGFHILRDIAGAPVDYYSFGAPEGKDTPRSGLNFANLGLDISFATPDPEAPPAVVTDRVITFDSGQIAFNIAASTPRQGSLYQAFSLDLEGLVTGPGDGDSPAALGYLNVVTQARMGGLGPAWNGLKFRLNLGSAGELAGKLGLNAYLLLAWAPDSTAVPDLKGVINYRATTGLNMPGTSNGAPMLSLQNVLAMSYGTIQLLYDGREGASPLHPATLRPMVARSAPAAESDKQFMLLLNEIAIKFMGLLKLPPSGSTAFYLFGDADPGAGDTTGLGWYAAYSNAPGASLSAATREIKR